MTTKEKLERKEATHELIDIIVFKIDLVGEPATGDEFLVTRNADGGQQMGRAAMSPGQYRLWTEKHKKDVTIALDRSAQEQAVTVADGENKKKDDPLDEPVPTDLKNGLEVGTSTTERAETGGVEMPELKEVLERFGGTLDQLGKDVGGITKRLGEIEERMNAAPQPTETAETTPKEEDKPKEEETAETDTKPVETPAVEKTPEAVETPKPEDIKPTPVPAAEDAPENEALDRVGKSVDEISATLKGVAGLVSSLQTDVTGIGGRLADVERSISTGKAKEPDENDDPPLERGAKTKEPLFGSVFRSMPGMQKAEQ